ncbi:phage antirepressor KilAC domain-containing protein [Pasteurella multocida]|uniref:phage antirepressor KilAC domain-containing protein n=1 Tax=Pasteurella multocida TaxID=747 RepID=UPI001F52BAA1|nr:phage regulatory protein/antirepressor Ant [Pasteurella multocida]
MNKLLNISEQNATITMSSREIAEICGKEHRHVLRDVENLNKVYAEMGLPKVGQGYYTHHLTGNQQHREFLLTREQCIDLITGYKTEVRIRINRRWQELEMRNAVDPVQLLNDPVYLRNALFNFSEKVIVLAPKAEAFDRLATETEGSMNLTNAAKHLQLQPRNLTQFLSSKRWIYKRISSKPWIAYQDKIQSGYLEHKANQYEDKGGVMKISEQVLVTAKGLAKISAMLSGAR